MIATFYIFLWMIVTFDYERKFIEKKTRKKTHSTAFAASLPSHYLGHMVFNCRVKPPGGAILKIRGL
jgi:hypothetical protein